MDCRYKDSFQIKTEYFERKVNVCFNPLAMSVADKNKENVPSRPPQVWIMLLERTRAACCLAWHMDTSRQKVIPDTSGNKQNPTLYNIL